jgi:hypothetical protein
MHGMNIEKDKASQCASRMKKAEDKNFGDKNKLKN